MTSLAEKLKKIIKGEVFDKPEILDVYSRDAGFFKLTPELVVVPRDVKDIQEVVNYVNKNKEEDKSLSLTVRAGGSGMSGGSINESIIMDISKNLNNFRGIEGDEATAEVGMMYRDFEIETLKRELLFPSFPASKDLCAIGGIVANNAGGEKTLAYGKTEDYVKKLKVVLVDGEEYLIEPLTLKELREKMSQENFEGEVYRKTFKLIEDNYEVIQKARPKISKNSAGYYLWNVYNKEEGVFDLTQLFVGSQGTLGIITEATIGLIRPKKYTRVLVVFMPSIKDMGVIIKTILKFNPETLESYDDRTLKLALRFFFQFLKILGGNIFSLAFKFIPEATILLSSGRLPKIILTAEFSGDNQKDVEKEALKAQETLKKFNVKTRVTKTDDEVEKYRAVRRESFNLLRKKIKGRQTAPFIDDIVIDPEDIPQFLPKLKKILEKYPDLIYTITGHMGNGNFHIIPLMDLKDPKSKDKIREITPKVYDLVKDFNGSITAEHNDGLIRTPFLKKMYGQEVYDLFKKVKKIFDPKNIFNPNKKVSLEGLEKDDLAFEYALKHITPK